MAIISGLHGTTAQNLQLDAGVLVHGLTPEEIRQLGAGTMTPITSKTPESNWRFLAVSECNPFIIAIISHPF